MVFPIQLTSDYRHPSLSPDSTAPAPGPPASCPVARQTCDPRKGCPGNDRHISRCETVPPAHHPPLPPDGRLSQAPPSISSLDWPPFGTVPLFPMCAWRVTATRPPPLELKCGSSSSLNKTYWWKICHRFKRSAVGPEPPFLSGI